MSLARDSEVLPDPGERMTAADYFRLPEGPPWFQLIDGQLFVSPSPRYFHQKLIARLLAAILTWAEEHDLGDVIAAPSDVQLDTENVFQPDLYFMRKARLGLIDSQGPKGAPDLVVEVLSPGTVQLDRGRKMSLYRLRGVEELWLVSPETSEVEVHRFGSSASSATFGVQDFLSTPLLPGLKIALAKLFKS